jgi:hypothetical protein
MSLQSHLNFIKCNILFYCCCLFSPTKENKDVFNFKNRTNLKIHILVEKICVHYINTWGEQTILEITYRGDLDSEFSKIDPPLAASFLAVTVY